MVARHLRGIVAAENIHLTIANGENSAGGFGITPPLADELFGYGVDVLTSGNHIWDKREIYDYLPQHAAAAAARELCGRASRVRRGGGGGAQWSTLRRDQSAGARLHAAPSSARFARPTPCWPRLPAEVKVRFVDFHAELTSEKMAMGWHLDGRVSAMIGTHTHIPTADTRILPGGTAYQTDAGMTGPYHSVIGVDKQLILERFLTQLPVRIEAARGGPELHGVVVEVDEATGRASAIKRVEVLG